MTYWQEKVNWEKKCIRILKMSQCLGTNCFQHTRLALKQQIENVSREAAY